jgi:DNA polymerase III subunit beta
VKLSTSSAELLAQLQTVSRVASTRSAVQALSGVQLAATPAGVELRATDMEIALRVPLQAEVAREGTVVLPARLLLDVARSLPKGAERVELELRPEQQDVEVIAGPAKFHLRTLRAEDFPPLPGVGGSDSGDTVVTVPAAAFVATIEKVAKSASRDETRPILTGILVSASGPELRMVATDSYRLSVKETHLDAPLDGGFEANVPARGLEELRAVVGSTGAEQIRIGVRSNQVVFEVGGAVLSSRLIDGQFPNYRQLIPESYEHELRISGEELGDVVKRISLMAQKNAPLRLSFAAGELTVSAQTPDVGEASEPLPVPFSGEPFEIGFNPDFLRDGLDSVGGEDLILKLISPLRPGLIEGADDSGFLYLIMPIRLNV